MQRKPPHGQPLSQTTPQRQQQGFQLPRYPYAAANSPIPAGTQLSLHPVAMHPHNDRRVATSLGFYEGDRNDRFSGRELEQSSSIPTSPGNFNAESASSLGFSVPGRSQPGAKGGAKRNVVSSLDFSEPVVNSPVSTAPQGHARTESSPFRLPEHITSNELAVENKGLRMRLSALESEVGKLAALDETRGAFMSQVSSSQQVISALQQQILRLTRENEEAAREIHRLSGDQTPAALRKEVDGLKGELNSTKRELNAWKEKYKLLAHRSASVKHQRELSVANDRIAELTAELAEKDAQLAMSTSDAVKHMKKYQQRKDQGKLPSYTLDIPDRSQRFRAAVFDIIAAKKPADPETGHKGGEMLNLELSGMDANPHRRKSLTPTSEAYKHSTAGYTEKSPLRDDYIDEELRRADMLATIHSPAPVVQVVADECMASPVYAFGIKGLRNCCKFVTKDTFVSVAGQFLVKHAEDMAAFFGFDPRQAPTSCALHHLSAVDVSRAGKLVTAVEGCRGGRVVVVRFDTPDVLRFVNRPTPTSRGFVGVCILPGGKRIVAVETGPTPYVHLFGISEGKLLNRSKQHISGRALCISAIDAERFVVGGENTVYFCKAGPTHQVTLNRGRVGEQYLRQSCLSIAHSNKGIQVVSGMINGNIYMWENNEVISKHLAHDGSVYSLISIPGGYVSGSCDCSVCIWSVSLDLVKRIELPSLSVCPGFGQDYFFALLDQAARGIHELSIRSLDAAKDTLLIEFSEGSVVFLKTPLISNPQKSIDIMTNPEHICPPVLPVLMGIETGPALATQQHAASILAASHDPDLQAHAFGYNTPHSRGTDSHIGREAVVSSDGDKGQQKGVPSVFLSSDGTAFTAPALDKNSLTIIDTDSHTVVSALAVEGITPFDMSEEVLCTALSHHMVVAGGGHGAIAVFDRVGGTALSSAVTLQGSDDPPVRLAVWCDAAVPSDGDMNAVPGYVIIVTRSGAIELRSMAMNVLWTLPSSEEIMYSLNPEFSTDGRHLRLTTAGPFIKSDEGTPLSADEVRDMGCTFVSGASCTPLCPQCGTVLTALVPVVRECTPVGTHLVARGSNGALNQWVVRCSRESQANKTPEGGMKAILKSPEEVAAEYSPQDEDEHQLEKKPISSGSVTRPKSKDLRVQFEEVQPSSDHPDERHFSHRSTEDDVTQF